jgi:hypothetical protein
MWGLAEDTLTKQKMKITLRLAADSARNTAWQWGAENCKNRLISDNMEFG